MGTRSVDYPYLGVLDERNCFPGRVVRKTQDDQIGRVEHFSPGFALLPACPLD
jgi:hypothetical protein